MFQIVLTQSDFSQSFQTQSERKTLLFYNYLQCYIQTLQHCKGKPHARC